MRDDAPAGVDNINKVRQTVIQVCGGIGFLFSIFMALSAQDSSNKDLKAKYDSETAQLFVKAVESGSPEALYALAYVAQRDTKNYHEEIFQVLSSLIRSLSPEACRTDGEAKEKATAKIRVALRLLHERAVSNDPQGITSISSTRAWTIVISAPRGPNGEGTVASRAYVHQAQ